MSETATDCHPLTAWRKTQGVTQGVMAGQLGITGSQLSQIETGRKSASLPLAIKICRLTGGAVPIDALVRPEAVQ